MKKEHTTVLAVVLAFIVLAIIGGWKWMEYAAREEEERAQLVAEAKREKVSLARDLAAAEKAASEWKSESEQLDAEKVLLEEKLADCEKERTAKRHAPRAKKKVVTKVKKPKPKSDQKPSEDTVKTTVPKPAPKQEEAPAEKQAAIAPEKKEEPKPVAVSAPAPSPKQEEPVAQKEKKEEKVEKKGTPTSAPQAPAQVSGYQLGGACTLSDGTPGMVTATFRNGNAQCSEVVLVPVPNKAKAVAQYIVCTTAGATVGYYNGGAYSAVSGAVGGAGGVYIGRSLGGEDWGWVGCATGPAAGLIKYGAAGGNGPTTGPTGPSGGGTGIGDIITGGGSGIN